MFKNPSALSEKEQQLLYVFKGALTPAMILDGTALVVRGWRTHFRKKAVFWIQFADIQGVRVETSFGSEMRSRRIALSTAAGPIPLTLVYQSGSAVADDARRIQAWLQTHGVNVPLVEETI